jgi:hypothetical protein
MILSDEEEKKLQKKQSEFATTRKKLGSPVYVLPKLSKEENEIKRQRILDIMESIVLYDLNNMHREK